MSALTFAITILAIYFSSGLSTQNDFIISFKMNGAGGVRAVIFHIRIGHDSRFLGTAFFLVVVVRTQKKEVEKIKI